MKTIAVKESLTKKYSWAVIGLIITYALFGIVSFAGQRVLSSMIMQGKMDLSTYQKTLYNFNLIVGILSSTALLVFYIFAAKGTSGSRRVAFLIGMISSFSPLFNAVSTTLLFRVIGLPSMGAGSVIAALATAVIIIIPTFIMFMIFVFCKKLKRSSRMLTLAIAILSLVIAFFPVVITVLTFVIMPGNPSMAPLMQLSAYLIHVRPIMIAIGLAVVYLINRDN